MKNFIITHEDPRPYIHYLQFNTVFVLFLWRYDYYYKIVKVKCSKNFHHEIHILYNVTPPCITTQSNTVQNHHSYDIWLHCTNLSVWYGLVHCSVKFEVLSTSLVGWSNSFCNMTMDVEGRYSTVCTVSILYIVQYARYYRHGMKNIDSLATEPFCLLLVIKLFNTQLAYLPFHVTHTVTNCSVLAVTTETT